MKIERIRVDRIAVIGRRRPINGEAVGKLAESMSCVGQLQPITVSCPDDKTCLLVTGAHRVEAAKVLGWSEIDAVRVVGSEIELEMQEIAENLHRAELTKLERDIQITRWAELVAAKSKEVQSAPPSGGHQPHDKGIKKVARELGLEKTDVIRAVKVASISEQAKQAARDAGLADNRTALLAVAKEPTPEAQVARVSEIAASKAEARARDAEMADSAPGNPANPEEVAGLLNALQIGLSGLDPVIDRVFGIGVASFWAAIKSDAGRKRFVAALEGACRLAAIATCEAAKAVRA